MSARDWRPHSNTEKPASVTEHACLTRSYHWTVLSMTGISSNSSQVLKWGSDSAISLLTVSIFLWLCPSYLLLWRRQSKPVSLSWGQLIKARSRLTGFLVLGLLLLSMLYVCLYTTFAGIGLLQFTFKTLFKSNVTVVLTSQWITEFVQLLSLFPSLQTHSHSFTDSETNHRSLNSSIHLFINPPTRKHNSVVFRGKKTNKIWQKPTKNKLYLILCKIFWIFVYIFTYEI